MTARQQALTVIAPVRSDIPHKDLSDRLVAIERAVQKALESASTLHFGRFVLLESSKGARLAFESNHDGERDAHLAELARVLAPFEDTLFGTWDGYQNGHLAAFVAANARPTSTFYLGHPGLAVTQIQNDDRVRARLAAQLDDDVRVGNLSGKTAKEVRGRLLSSIANDESLVTGAVDRGFPPRAIAMTAFYVVVVIVFLPIILLLMPFILAVEYVERQRDKTERRLLPDSDARLTRIAEREDGIGQNGLTHHVPVRPGHVRRATLKVALAFVEWTRKTNAYLGDLGGIRSIHFARWLVLDDDTVLFFSNYDGSWESYLGDFVDKAALYLTVVWTNTRWFPDTRGLVFKGAARESDFKRWTRTFQVENQIWYSAYPHLSVNDVLTNAAIREGAAGDMTESEARAWLARL